MVSKYISYLKKEIEIYSHKLKDYSLNTVFIGGGTPSYIDGRYIYEILDSVNRYFNTSNLIEVSIEANPKTLDERKLDIYKNAGINRISLGVQTLDDKLLKKIGRIHTSKDFMQTYNIIRKKGFENINTDIMFNLPGQKIEDVLDTLKKIINLDVEHISFYSLKLEEGTPFYSKYYKDQSELPDEDTERNMYYRGIELLERKGYIHYEISNFARKNYECKHNLIYWNVKPYLGVGLGAHSNMSKKRWSNRLNFEDYFSSLDREIEPIQDVEYINKATEMSEFVILGLRLIKGIWKDDFKKRFGIEIYEVFGEQLEKFQIECLIKIDNGNIRLTRRGIDLSNIVFAELLI